MIVEPLYKSWIADFWIFVYMREKQNVYLVKTIVILDCLAVVSPIFTDIFSLAHSSEKAYPSLKITL